MIRHARMVVGIYINFLQKVFGPNFEMSSACAHTSWHILLPLEMNLDDFTWILNVLERLRKAKDHWPWNIYLASIGLPFCYHCIYAWVHMVTGVFKHAQCSGNIPRIIGALLFCTCYCIFQFDSHLLSTYMSMRIAKHTCMLQHWGKLPNVFIHEYNQWAPSFPCLNA